MTLSESRFSAIVKAAKNLPGTNYNVTLSNGKVGTRRVVDFYGSAEYDKALGRATIYYNNKGRTVGFSDYYDFDPKNWGVRSTGNEIKTRMVYAAGVVYGASPYAISYGIGPKP